MKVIILDVDEEDAFYEHRDKLIGKLFTLIDMNEREYNNDLFNTFWMKGCATAEFGMRNPKFGISKGNHVWFVKVLMKEIKDDIPSVANKRQKRVTTRKHTESSQVSRKKVRQSS